MLRSDRTFRRATSRQGRRAVFGPGGALSATVPARAVGLAAGGVWGVSGRGGCVGSPSKRNTYGCASERDLPGAASPAAEPERGGRPHKRGVCRRGGPGAGLWRWRGPRLPLAGHRLGLPRPRAISDARELVWDEDDLALDNYRALARRLAAAGDIYRRPAYAGGLLLAPERPNIEPTVVDSARRLASAVVDRVRVRVVKNGNTRGNRIPADHLSTMLGCEAFLQQFRPVDDVVRSAHYLPGFNLMRPGYNDAGPGQRLLYVGPELRVERSLDAVNAFLGVMAFATEADRTNAVGAALTVMLRNFWPGAKPALVATASKSHAGKDTVIQFACGGAPHVSVSYQGTDWALERSVVGAVKHSPETGVLIVENARLGRRDRQIASAFLERLVTDPEPLFFATGTGAPVRRKNHLVLAISTNFGTVSEDLLNRALPIHLDPVGNVADRQSRIGNPKLEYLPANRERIEAELRGMVEKWKESDRPLDLQARHPFTDWARVVGGILKCNGFTDFLGNYSLRRTADDPVRKALGVLGAARPGEWLRSDCWARLAQNVGVVKAVVGEHDRGTDQGRARGIGVLLSAHRGETFEVETEDQKMTLKLEKARRRFDGFEPSTRYRFVVLGRAALPEDPDQPAP
jgi:hypothetical protein